MFVSFSLATFDFFLGGYILLSALASLFGPFCFLAFGPRNCLQISRNYLQGSRNCLKKNMHLIEGSY